MTKGEDGWLETQKLLDSMLRWDAAQNGKADAAKEIFMEIVSTIENGELQTLSPDHMKLIALVFQDIGEADGALKYFNSGVSRTRGMRTYAKQKQVFLAVERLKTDGVSVSEDKALADVATHLNMSISSVSRHYYAFKKDLNKFMQKNLERLQSNYRGPYGPEYFPGDPRRSAMMNKIIYNSTERGFKNELYWVSLDEYIRRIERGKKNQKK